MKKNNILKITLLISLAIALSFSITTATYTPIWKVNIDNALDNYTDRLTAGVGPDVTDEYNPAVDVMNPPPVPSGKSIQIISTVPDAALIIDYRPDLEANNPKTWQLTLIAVDSSYNGLSGTNRLTWGYSDVPNKVKLTLIDYGTDSTRTDVIEEIDMKDTSTYTFDVSESVGPYRYMEMVAGIGNTNKNPKKK